MLAFSQPPYSILLLDSRENDPFRFHFLPKRIEQCLLPGFYVYLDLRNKSSSSCRIANPFQGG